jgi:hypothetical protein
MRPVAGVACLAWLLLLGGVGCGDDPSFESLGRLCADLAEDICDARAGGCCPGVNPDACLAGERSRCEAELDGLNQEELRYSSTEAFDKRRAARSQLDHCGAPPVLASFFTGGLPDGASCERDAQCSGGLCSPGRRCAQAQPALCGN